MTSATMKLPPSMHCDNVLFMAVLIILAVITILGLIADPNRPAPRKSRIGWPPSKTTKP